MKRPTRLTPEVDPDRDHILGGPKPDFTLVEYGSYASEYCHAAHEIVENLRERFGERLRFVYRHLPIPKSRGAELSRGAATYVTMMSIGAPRHADWQAPLEHLR